MCCAMWSSLWVRSDRTARDDRVFSHPISILPEHMKWSKTTYELPAGKKVQWEKRKSEIMKLYDVLEIQWDNGSKQNLRVPLDVQRAEIMMFSYGRDNRVYDWKKILLQEFISNVVEMGTKFDLCDVLVR